MAYNIKQWPQDKTALYKLLRLKMTAYTDGEPDMVCALSNVSALIYDALPDLNWAGFYRAVDENMLLLAPFQGKPACTRIEKGKGVCGTAWETGKEQLVIDVHEFPGHIACDSASNSEFVLPLYQGEKFWGLLDLDSPTTGRFTQEDREGLLSLKPILEKMLTEAKW